jgi:hypothetical protein
MKRLIKKNYCFFKLKIYTSTSLISLYIIIKNNSWQVFLYFLFYTNKKLFI